MKLIENLPTILGIWAAASFFTLIIFAVLNQVEKIYTNPENAWSKKQAVFALFLCGPLGWASILIWAVVSCYKMIWRALK